MKAQHKLTPRQVRAIRKRYAPWGRNTMERIAKDYGVSVATVWAVVHRKNGYDYD